jgi:anti-sigma regulatory factor (Ser/Thr protein kinase)
MVEIPDLLNRPNQQSTDTYKAGPLTAGHWSWALELDAISLKKFTPIPLLMTTLQELSVHQTDRNILFTVVSELFNNAFEHGVLGLDSAIKTSASGFEEYYRLRKHKAKKLSEGWVSIAIEFDGKQTRQFTINVADSGSGFEVVQAAEQSSEQQYSGRGLRLVESLCESMEFNQQGNCVTAVYRCQH